MENTALRDELAVERTRLANERTLLAYVRTALALVAGGAVLLHFFPTPPSLVGLAWLLVVCGAVTLTFGVFRFLQVRTRLNAKP